MKKLRRSYVLREVWRHNAFIGSVRMARMNMKSIEYSATASERARTLAHSIELQLQVLHELLQERVDPPSAFQESQE